MFNVKVFKMKDLIKYCLGFIIIICIIYIVIKKAPQQAEKQQLKLENTEKVGAFFDINLISCIDASSTIIKEINKTEDIKPQTYKNDFFEDILKSQISLIECESEEEVSEIQENNELENNQEQNQEKNNENQATVEGNEGLELAKTGLTTEVITNNPIALNFNRQYKDVKIKNQTTHELTDDMLNPDISIDNKNILLFHTHTCESYTSSQMYPYESNGNFRTTDLNFTVARLGTELTNHLNQYGYNVIHDITYHDYPSYNGSYTRSLETVQKILKDNPTDIIFDIHRDAIGSRSDYAPCVKIGDDIAAQIMFVVGSDEGGLWHPNWNQNLKFAIKVQQKAEEMYPGLFKPITLTKYRYNQHTGKYASIIEVGATGNTLEQCLNSMKYLAKVLAEVIQ